jgi:hypothetical protein
MDVFIIQAVPHASVGGLIAMNSIVQKSLNPQGTAQQQNIGEHKPTNPAPRRRRRPANMKTTLTSRSQIVVKWTTAPSDMGYGGTPTGWREEQGERMGIRRAAQFSYELGQKVGAGTYRVIAYWHNGRPIDLGEIVDAVRAHEYDFTEKGKRF